LHVFLTGYYFSGDGAQRTKSGYYRITGRMDDVLNVSGHRLGTAEIEDVLVWKFISQLYNNFNLFMSLLYVLTAPME
jgi:non-ribosomal peptide synthetase component E (peptide arylation enzyme)